MKEWKDEVVNFYANDAVWNLPRIFLGAGLFVCFAECHMTGLGLKANVG